uniref:Dynein axonemal intermediate chain 4 n=1 Tax=Echinococcus granulosus TaxID=6210 RepID=A0A068WKV9_ECHGR|nr:WD repeat containing protein 78 [Echinococcus granulosus]
MSYIAKKPSVPNQASPDTSSNRGIGYSVSKLFSEQQMQIFDEFGNDLTPLPMIFEDKRVQQMDKENTLDPSILQTSQLQFFNLPFSRSLQSVSNPFSETTSEQSESHVTKNESVAEVREIEEEETSENIDLDEQIYITVAETEVYWLFDQQPYFMPSDDEFASYQIQRNSDYKALCAARLGNDRYVERGMNTMPNPTIVKVSQTKAIKYSDKAVNATVYDIWDSVQQALKEGYGNRVDKTPRLDQDATNSRPPMRSSDIPTAISRNLIDKSNPLQLSEGIGDVNTVSGECVYSDRAFSVDTGEIISMNTGSGDNVTTFSKSQLLQSLDANDRNLLNLLKNMEKALNLNCYYEKYLHYRSVLLNRLFEESHKTSEASESDATAAPSPSATKSNRASAAPLMSGVGETEAEGPRPSVRQTTFVRQSLVLPPLQPDTATTADTHDPSTPNGGGGGSGAPTEGSRMSGPNTENGVERASNATRKATGNKPLAVEATPSLYLNGSSNIYTPPALLLLWRFGCSFTKGRNVASLAFNPRNKDILAVGYGAFEFDRQQSGLVCCWSVKKINFPERLFCTPSGVTTIAWSSKNENLLAVGMFNGVIAIFDVRKGSQTPILDTTHATGRHYSPVCKLEWVSREAGRSAGHAESLISCSMDGRITEWFTLKGFDCTDLMLLKRPRLKIPNYAMKKKHAEALIVRHAVGTALCFNDLDPNIYLVGTENGQIHRCSCSYAEQYLNTYNGHTSSVYAVKYSPFLPDVFLSCSADWTVRLWHSDRQKCYLNMATHSSAVNDLTWSHNHGAVFACTNEGNLEIWDLERSTLDPVHVESVCADTTMSAVLFTEDSDVSRSTSKLRTTPFLRQIFTPIYMVLFLTNKYAGINKSHAVSTRTSRVR